MRARIFKKHRQILWRYQDELFKECDTLHRLKPKIKKHQRSPKIHLILKASAWRWNFFSRKQKQCSRQYISSQEIRSRNRMLYSDSCRHWHSAWLLNVHLNSQWATKKLKHQRWRISTHCSMHKNIKFCDKVLATGTLQWATSTCYMIRHDWNIRQFWTIQIILLFLLKTENISIQYQMIASNLPTHQDPWYLFLKGSRSSQFSWCSIQKHTDYLWG